MAVLEHFYQISERDAETVSSKWKAFHIAFFVVGAVCGYFAIYTFGKSLETFNNFCILNADVHFINETYEEYPVHTTLASSTLTNTTDGFNDTIPQTVNRLILPPILNGTNATENENNSTTNRNRTSDGPIILPTNKLLISIADTLWGSRSSCSFCGAMNVVSMISSIIWGAFFLILPRGGAGYENDLINRPWRVVYPCIAFSIIISIILFVSALVMSTGYTAFCRAVGSHVGISTCKREINDFTQQFHNGSKQPFYNYYYIATTCAYFGFFAWVAQIVLLFMRIFFVVDFNVHFIQVYDKEEEYVQNVIESEHASISDENSLSIQENTASTQV